MNSTRNMRTHDEALAQIAGALSLAIGDPNTGEYVDCILEHIRGALEREQKAWDWTHACEESRERLTRQRNALIEYVGTYAARNIIDRAEKAASS